MKKKLTPCIYVLVLLATPALGQQILPHDVKRPPATAPKATNVIAADPSPEAKAAFLALAEPDRKALQDGLGWLGFYNGTIDGAFGRRTIDALIAYQRSVSATADGVVTSKALADIRESEAKAKAAVGFQLVDNASSGARIGAPTKLLLKRDGVTLTIEVNNNTASKKNSDTPEAVNPGGLEAIYKALSADTPNRKVTYKFLKPGGFFVVAGEEGDKKFYRRSAAPPAGWPNPNEIRGFVFSYPRDRAKALDPVALAVANSFDPFPTAPLPPPAAPTPSPTPEGPKLTATALVVGPGVAVTTIDARRCKSPTIQGKPARFLEGEGPLARLGGDFGAGAATPALAEGGDDLVALSLASAGGTKTTLQVDAVQAAPGGGAKVIAALGAAASGAPLFDRQGRLVAFVAPIEKARTRAGVVLAEPHATTSAASLAPGGAAHEGPLSAPEIARLRRSAVVGVFCAS